MKKAIKLILGVTLLIASASASALSFKTSDFNMDDDDHYDNENYYVDNCITDGWGRERCDSVQRDSDSPMRWKSGRWDTGSWGGGPFNMDSRDTGFSPWNFGGRNSPWGGRNSPWGGRNSPWSSTPWNWNNRDWGGSRGLWNRGNHRYGNTYRRGPYGGRYSNPYNAGPGLAPKKPYMPQAPSSPDVGVERKQ